MTAIVRLSADDVIRIARFTDELMAVADALGRRMKFQPIGGETRRDVNIRGFAAELAVARYLDVPWRETFDTEKWDLEYDGRRLEVRNARWSNGPLWVRDKRADLRLVLTTGVPPPITLVGWIDSADAMVPAYWLDRPPRPGWCVPQRDLHEIRLLRTWPAGWDGWDGWHCYTCGAEPTGEFRDGSPRFDHQHEPVVVRGWQTKMELE